MRHARPCLSSILSILSILSIPSLAADWPQLGNGPQHTGYSPEKLKPPFKLKWNVQFQPERLYPAMQPVIAGGRIFLGTESGGLHCLSAADGKRLWSFAAGPILHSAGVEGGKVFFASMDGCVYALEAELDAQVKKMLEAGRLAPWVYADNIPINASRGDYYWGEPGEALYLLAQLYPVVKKEQQAALLECMADIRKAFPPETTPLMPPDKGARRGGYDVGPCHVSKIIAEERGKRVSLFALYGLERYYALSGTKPTPEEWEACKKVITAAFEEQGWATLYHLGHPNRFLPWEGANPAEREQLRKEHGATESWRGDRPAAIVNANRRFSGAIGAIRLARLMGDKETEQQAWWLFARTAVLRYAMGKYAQWRYQAGLAKLPPKADWFWAWRGRGPQNWCGDLETMNWSKPEHDVQQVIELAPDRVELGHWADVMGDKWHQFCTAQPVAFRYLTPELAAFLRDHLKPECAAYADRIAWNQPTWYASFAPAILGYEHNMNHPSDAYEHFMARSWILGEKPEQLEKWIDIPWLELGDLFYLNKLAETLRAYRAAKP